MVRSTVSLTLDTDLVVLLLHRASAMQRGFNEEVEEDLALFLLDCREKGQMQTDGSKLEDIYGQVHNHWEGQTTRHHWAEDVPF